MSHPCCQTLKGPLLVVRPQKYSKGFRSMKQPHSIHLDCKSGPNTQSFPHSLRTNMLIMCTHVHPSAPICRCRVSGCVSSSTPTTVPVRWRKISSIRGRPPWGHRRSPTAQNLHQPSCKPSVTQVQIWLATFTPTVTKFA